MLKLTKWFDMFENTVKIYCLNSPINKSDHFVGIYQGGVYITTGRFSRQHEFTPVPSHGSIFVYMILPLNVMPARVTPAGVHSGCCTGARIGTLRYGDYGLGTTVGRALSCVCSTGTTGLSRANIER